MILRWPETGGRCISCGFWCGLTDYCWGCKTHACESCRRPMPFEPVFGPPKGHSPEFHLKAGRAALTAADDGGEERHGDR